MAECILSSPHRYDPGSSVYGNLFGDHTQSTELPAGICQSSFFTGVGLSSFVLLAGVFLCVFLWRRTPRWSTVLLVGSFSYWVALQTARLNVLLKPYGLAANDSKERQYWIEAAVSQAIFELIVFAIIPVTLTALTAIAARKVAERAGSNEGPAM